MYLGFNKVAVRYLRKYNRAYPCKRTRYIRKEINWDTNKYKIYINDGVIEQYKEDIPYKKTTLRVSFLTFNGMPIESTK